MERILPGGRLVALDVLAMEPIDGVEFIHGNFAEDSVFKALLERVGERQTDLVLSDMAPNISGIKCVDQPRSLYLAELAYACANRLLRSGGDLLVKVFQGAGVEAYSRCLKQSFGKVQVRKPKASRSKSDELYMLARNYRL
jgi:23S rRNA (uridine2552-2'-O)-methyltransferase